MPQHLWTFFELVCEVLSQLVLLTDFSEMETLQWKSFMKGQDIVTTYGATPCLSLLFRDSFCVFIEQDAERRCIRVCYCPNKKRLHCLLIDVWNCNIVICSQTNLFCAMHV